MSLRSAKLSGVAVVAALFVARSASADVPAGFAACAADAASGQEARDNAHLIEARKRFAACSSEACPLTIRRDCSEWLAQVNTRIPSLVISVRDASGRDVVDARVSVDGAPFQTTIDGQRRPVDPGPHLLRVDPASGPGVEQRIVVLDGETLRTVLLELPATKPTPDVTAPPPPSRAEKSPSWPLFLAGAVAVGGFATFAGFGLSARSSFDDLEGRCGGGTKDPCAASDVDSVERKALIANIGLGVGVVALAATAWLFLRREAR